jgi:ABC-type glycerol-3-phosphate transport system substrate-binding protein
VALGEWRNIANAKAILSALIMQAGDPIVGRSSEGVRFAALGLIPEGAAESPAQSALRFYTEFANPGKTVYSWNRALPEAQSAFIAGEAAVYFGFASEYATLRARNPNINIGVDIMPQIQGNTSMLTYGNVWGVAVPRTAQNAQGAAAVAQAFAGAEFSAALASGRGLPSVRRDAAQDTTGNAVAAVFAQSALMARGWADPSPRETDTLFETMIESVSSGRSTPAEAVSNASRLLEQLLRSQRLVP